jgi:hypothetical protein
MGQRHAPAAFKPPGKTRYPLYRRLGGPQGPVWTGAENLVPYRDSIPGPFSPQTVAIPTELPGPRKGGIILSILPIGAKNFYTYFPYFLTNLHGIHPYNAVSIFVFNESRCRARSTLPVGKRSSNPSTGMDSP